MTSAAMAQHMQALDEVGFVVLPGLVDPGALDKLHRVVDDGFTNGMAAGPLFEGGGFFSGHLNCYPGRGAEFAYDEVRASGVFDMVRLMNPVWADRPRVTLNYNMPGSVAQHYHMDGIYTQDFLICNVAVVDTDLVNGALDVLPGTNREFYPFWKYAVQRKFKDSTRVPLRQGDVVVRRSTLWHRGMPNRSAVARPMLAVTFGEVHEPNVDPFLQNGGEIEFYPNWFRPTRLGRLREKTFVKAPITYSAYRFARSLYGNKGYAS
ncbi:MAG: kanJ [Ilumatobacteraceae bacterium]|nr:kanJ [Ilumatobacteraceae bacterium]